MILNHCKIACGMKYPIKLTLAKDKVIACSVLGDFTGIKWIGMSRDDLRKLIAMNNWAAVWEESNHDKQ